MAHILVVDDEPDIVRVVVQIMKERGHVVETALNGEEALECARAQPPDLVILDLLLPNMDGGELCWRLRDEPVTRHIPVLMMTAKYVSLDEVKRDTGIGADAYVMKPFTRDVLLRNAERLLPGSD
ncbi:MAG: response regulator [Proteobacteria bacterium]|nr:response regulator [Pseudomonadota bacterium]